MPLFWAHSPNNSNHRSCSHNNTTLTLIYRGRDTPFNVAQEVVRHHLAKPALPVGNKSDEETGFQPTTRRTCKGGDTAVSPDLCMTRHDTAGSIHCNTIMNSIGYYMTFSIAPEPENRFFGHVSMYRERKRASTSDERISLRAGALCIPVYCGSVGHDSKRKRCALISRGRSARADTILISCPHKMILF